MSVGKLDDPKLPDEIGQMDFKSLTDELELLELAGNPFDAKQFLAGKVTPVFFGSAMTNFGVEPLLERLTELVPTPQPRATTAGDVVGPDDDFFSGFVFKIQANMDPRHRDRIAFLRICSASSSAAWT